MRRNRLCQRRRGIEHRELHLVLLAHSIAQFRGLELLQHLAIAGAKHVVVARQLGEFGFDLWHGLDSPLHVSDAASSIGDLTSQGGQVHIDLVALHSDLLVDGIAPPGCRPPGCP